MNPMREIILIDNYDSFSYNLYQLIGSVIEQEYDGRYTLRVIRNDEMTVQKIGQLEPAAIVLSPGPGRPVDAGVCEDVVRELGASVPVLGVCLGHQAIVEALGGIVGYAKSLMHGKSSMIAVDGNSRLLAGLSEQAVQVARYHSLAADSATLPDCLFASAKTDDGEIMAVEHREWPIFGVQFHPESILTPQGDEMIRAFLNIVDEFQKEGVRND